MPPAAISRSSTYFPKICGNIAPRYRSSIWLFSLLLGCGEQPAVDKRLPIRLYGLVGCAPPSSAHVTLHALGDFRPSNRDAEFLPLSGANAVLAFPGEAQAIEARVETGGRSFSGYGERQGDEGVELLLWPERRACRLPPQPPPEAGTQVSNYPAAGGGQALGYAPALGLVLAAGGGDQSNTSAIVGATSLDTWRGEVLVIDEAAKHVLREPRAFATVSQFGSKLLVAGGENSLLPEGEREARANAEVYDPETQRFELAPLPLLSERTRHAALTLPGGETLLIGGESRGSAFAVLEAVSPETRSSSIAALARLQVARIEPKALRLSDGRIFVGGGYTTASKAIALLEWFTPDGSASATQLRDVVPARFDRAFVAMPGGALLAVGGCEDRVPVSPMEAAECAAECRRGCPPSSYDAFWISAEGGAAQVALPDGIRAPRPILMPGSDGAPWLVVDEGTERALFRFNPWTAEFVRAPSDIDIPDLPSPNLPDPVALAPDAFVWIHEGPAPEKHTELIGARLGTRSRFADAQALVVLADPFEPSRAQHLAPDRVPGTSAVYDGVLTLSAASAEAATVFVTDTDYQNLTLQVQLASGPPPLVVLGESVFGGEGCAWPANAGLPSEDNQPSLTRHGSDVELSYGGVRVRCPGPEGRLSVGLRAASSDATRILRIDVLRDPS